MVVLLTFVAGLAITVLLNRHAQAALAEARTVANYTDHHEQQGLRILVGTITQFNGTPPGQKQTFQPNEVLLNTKGGRRISVRITDAHGRILSDPSTSGGTVMADAAESLRAQYPDADKRFLRNRGPGRVCINSAPEPVIVAILNAIDPEAPAPAFAASVLKARIEAPLQATDIGRLLKEVGVDEEVQAVALRAFTSDSTLSRVQVEVADSAGKVLSRHLGLISTAGGGAIAATNWTFLAFDRVEAFDDETAPVIPR